MRFRGKVQFRSSKDPTSRVPGEAKILELNPERRERILQATGWQTLFEGSLNLVQVPVETVDALLGLHPVLVELGTTIRYPSGLEHIPLERKSYLYFRAVAAVGAKKHEVLARRHEVPPYSGLVELFAPRSLTTYFGLMEGDTVTVTVVA